MTQTTLPETRREPAPRRTTGCGPESDSPPRVLVFSTSATQPRHHRRVEMLLAAGCRVTVYAFERAYYLDNHFPAAVEVVPLGRLVNERYVSRLVTLLRAAARVWRVERGRPRPALTYGFGLDALMLGALCTARIGRLVYELGDVRVVRSGPLAAIMARLESFFVRRCGLVVLTSAGFVEQVSGGRSADLGGRCLVVENRLQAAYARRVGRVPPSPTPHPIRMGYVGLLRYEEAFHALLEAVRRHTDGLELHIHGDGPLRGLAEQFAGATPHIHYHGAFRNPDDLARIYRSLDVCYVVYDPGDINVRLALPNKLYECTYFGVPLVVAGGTLAAERVTRWGVGWTVDAGSSSGVGDLLAKLSRQEIDRVKQVTMTVRDDVLVDDGVPFSSSVRALVARTRAWVRTAESG